MDEPEGLPQYGEPEQTQTGTPGSAGGKKMPFSLVEAQADMQTSGIDSRSRLSHVSDFHSPMPSEQLDEMELVDLSDPPAQPQRPNHV